MKFLYIYIYIYIYINITCDSTSVRIRTLIRVLDVLGTFVSVMSMGVNITKL